MNQPSLLATNDFKMRNFPKKSVTENYSVLADGVIKFEKFFQGPGACSWIMQCLENVYNLIRPLLSSETIMEEALKNAYDTEEKKSN